MRHLKAGRKLSRNSAERRALYRNMVTSLFRHGRITTTEPKAKELRRVAERLVTISKRGIAKARDQKSDSIVLAARRRARTWITDREVLQKLFDDIADRYSERPGGYTRIIKLEPRYGDNAPMAIIEMIEGERKAPPPPPPAEEPTAKKGKKKAAAEPVAEEPAAKKTRARKKAEEEPAAEEKPKRTRKKKAEKEE